MKKFISILASLTLVLGTILPMLAPLTAQAQAQNIALNKPVTCSPAPEFPCAEAVDGNLGTRWASVQGIDPQWIYVDLGATTSISRVVLRWEAAYGKSYQIQTSNDASNWTNIYTTTTGDGGVDDLTGLSGSGRYIRMHGTVRGTGYGYSLWEFEIYGGTSPTNTPTNTAVGPTPTRTNTPTGPTNTPTNTLVPSNTPTRTNTPTGPTNTPTNTQAAGCGSTNVAQGKPATASSSLGGNTAPMAVDGNIAGTRWESVHGVDPQWIYADLGSTQSICRVVLRWETAYGKSYTIQTSNDASSWTPIYTTTTGDGGVDDLTGLSGSGRYVRMHGTVRATGWGYSLWEFEIYTGSGGPTNTPTNTAVGPTNTPTNTAVGPTSTPTNTPVGSWTLVWNDDFNGAANTSPSGANWILRTGTQYPGGPANWGTGEVEVASASTANVYLDGAGHLNIKAIKDGGGNWTSGRVETQLTNFMANAGEMVRFTAILQQPNPAVAWGYWPGFRATGAAYRGNYNNWPGVGETDIMTNVNGRNQLSNTLHCGTAPAGVCNEYDGRTSGFATCAGCQTGYHEYTQIIDRTKTDEEIRFYLDGQQTWIVRESQVGVAAWQAAVHHGFYLSFVLSIGGSLPNALAGFTTPTAATSSDGILSIDSVAVHKSTGTVPPAMTDPGIPAGPSIVDVTGSQGNWQLIVNGAPYIVKGLTYGPPQNATDGYMRDLKAMGVNTIRTWGVDDANTPSLLNTAARHGLKVIVGHWLNQGTDYVNDTAYKNAVKAEIVARVNTLKNYQGVLMWDVGNEVLLTMQDFGLPPAEVEARRNAYAQFVNEVTVAIHAADSNHPVTSTDAWTGAWVYYKNHSPALDLLAVNSYGAIGTVKQDWINGGHTKPYILTEGGPAGEWEVPNDINGIPTEPTDLQKRDGYTASWNALMSHPGVSFGGTEFHYGLENDFGGVWLNVFGGGWRRLGYYALKQAYGQSSTNTPPEITAMTVSSQTGVPAGGQFTVNATVSDPNGDPLRYNLMFSNKHINGNRGFDHVIFTQTGNGAFTVTAPQLMGVWKVYVYAYDGHGNVGIETRSFKVNPPSIPGTNIAIGKPTTASSVQASPPLPASNATDNNYTTRWASDWSDPQWIRVDLGSTQSFNRILLGWEASYGKSYQIQTSNDGTNWTTIYSTTTGDGGFDDLIVSGSGRYVRMHGTVRGTAWGYSLWEFGIYQ